MEAEALASTTHDLYPVLIIPKRCTTLETYCEESDNVFIDLSITSPDTDGNEACIYSGFCNIKLVDSQDGYQDQSLNLSIPDEANKDQSTVPDNISYSPCNQSQVWIDPARSPNVYNSCATTETQERFSIYQQPHSSHITVEQHNTYITQNVYNYKDSIRYSPLEEFEHKKFRKNLSDTNHNSLADQIFYEDDEFECGVFLSKLPEEIWNEHESRAKEQMMYVGLQSENNALKQLMSTNIQSMSKQHKTILFLGQDSHLGETIQKISIDDPYLQCTGISEVDHEVVIDKTKATKPNKKKYQCDKCKQIFAHIVEFKQHMVANHRSPKEPIEPSPNEVRFMCLECGKTLKNQKKFKVHCLGHGNPDLECNKCHKVFASKFTLRTHKKIHLREYPCKQCTKSYDNFEELKSHAAKTHYLFMCRICNFTADTVESLKEHSNIHTVQVKKSSDAEVNMYFGDDMVSENSTLSPNPEVTELEIIDQDAMVLVDEEEIAKADSIIAKVVSNEMFLKKSTRKKRGEKFTKTCDVCLKSFDRIGNLKRHLIEHAIQSTLGKNPVDDQGSLKIICEVCQTETFTKIDKYKAHLREHAKLTLYKCTYCDKSFSDSSNFSKHKKIHGFTYFQCDLCHRKFNSKKMITLHMEYHKKNAPIPCYYCGKEFHFESMLNKHIKCSHSKAIVSKVRCRLCHKYLKSLKEKWDHEWTEHNVRKMIIDCKLCNAKFRKYSELKSHCSNVHKLIIPAAKKLLKKGKFY